jgi:TetR/AcrR family transcriptional regulator
VSTDDAPPPSAPPAAEPPAKKKKLRKEEIVAEATRLFAERGYEGTSMGDLAERVGLRKASLFHHFESKDALYAAVLSDLLAGLKVVITRALATEGSFPDRLDTLTDALTTTLSENPHAARLLIREAMDWGPIMRQRLADEIEEVLQASAMFARAGQSEGVVKTNLDPRHLVISLIGVHFIPFVIDRTVERFAGASPYSETFLEERRAAVRALTRELVLIA